MKNKMKKLVTFGLVSCFAVSMIQGCGNPDTGSSAETSKTDTETQMSDSAGNAGETTESEMASESILPLKETETYTMYALYGGQGYELEENPAFQKLCENANIEFEITSIATGEDSQKIAMALSSGDYPEVLFRPSFTDDQLWTYASEGILIPLEDLIREYAPNLTAYLDENDYWSYVQSADGHVYSLPYFRGLELHGSFPYWINTTWLDNLGLAEPKNLDELYNVLLAFKEQDANGNGDPDDEIPLYARSGLLGFEHLFYHFGVDGDVSWYREGDDVKYTPTSDVYYEFLEYMAKLYAEDLINDDVFTIDVGNLYANSALNADKIGGVFAIAPFTFVGNDYDFDFNLLTPFEEGTRMSSMTVSLSTLCITDVCENPEYVIAWADQFYTYEGTVLTSRGVEGKSYEVLEDGTHRWLVSEEYPSVSELVNKFGLNAFAIPPGIAELELEMPEFIDPSQSGEYTTTQHYVDEINRIYPLCAEPWPKVIYTEEEQERYATLFADLDSLVQTYKAQVITGEKDLASTWEDYVAELKQIGSEEFEAIQQAAYDRAIGK